MLPIKQNTIHICIHIELYVEVCLPRKINFILLYSIFYKVEKTESFSNINLNDNFCYLM